MKKLNIKTLKLKDLKPAEYNPRRSTEVQEQKLRESLEKFGCVEPIIVNENPERKNVIVGGHFRVRELEKLGEKEVDCVVVNLGLEEEKELNIRLNANTGEWDKELLNLNFDIGELSDFGLDFNSLDFDIGGKDEFEKIDGINSKNKRFENTLIINGKKLIMTGEESELIESQLEEYLKENTTTFGFVRWLCNK